MENTSACDPSTWAPELDAVTAAPKNHIVLFENDRLRVLEVILEPSDEEPVHHHRWPSVFVFDQIKGPIHDFSPEGEMLPPKPRCHARTQGMERSRLSGRQYGSAAGWSRLECVRSNVAWHTD